MVAWKSSMPGDDKPVSNPYKELARRFVLTVLLGILLYRFGVFIPIPGVNVQALADLIKGDGAGSQVLKWANMFNGGAIANASVFGLGIMPYISASIIIQILGFSYPALKQLMKEGEVGRRKINQYTRYITVLICMVQGGMACYALHNQPNIVDDFGILFVTRSMLVITCGSMVLLWIGEQISKHGVGNGVSVIIMVGILAYFPGAMANIAQGSAGQPDIPKIMALLTVFLVIIASLVVITMARRRVRLEQQRRIQGNRVYGGNQTQLPLMLNHAGVIPVIFASPLLILLGMLLGMVGLGSLLDFGGPLYRYAFCAIIVFFTYFYISVTVDLNEWANNFKQGGFFIRGIKPGKNTADYLKVRLHRITFVGALSLAGVAVIPPLLGQRLLGFGQDVSQNLLGGIGLLIVVGVMLDVIQKTQSFLLAHQYQGLMNSQGGRMTLGGPAGAKPEQRF